MDNKESSHVLLVIPQFQSSARLQGCSSGMARGICLVERDNWNSMKDRVLSDDWMKGLPYYGKIQVFDNLSEDNISLLKQIENRDVLSHLEDLLEMPTSEFKILKW